MKTQKLSLVQRLWLLLLCLMILSIGGALIANVLNSRSYLEQQLTAQSADTANALALMLTQYKADPVMAQVLLNATFEQGHFAEVRWDNTQGMAIIRLRNAVSNAEVPAWFIRRLPLSPLPGLAQVNNGWQQAGRIVVTPDLGYAYSALWNAAVQTVLGLAGVGLVAAIMGFVDIRRLRGQLRLVVRQARDIGEHRFVQIPVPGIPELAEVARAMNQMVQRLQNYLSELLAEVERLRKEVLTDSSTRLPNFKAFNRHFSGLLAAQEAPVDGYLLLIRVADLTELNQRQGGTRTDALLARIAEDLQRQCQSRPGWMATRLRGADFALLCPELAMGGASALARELCGLWPMYQSMALTERAGVGHIGLTAFHTGDAVDQVLRRANQSLAIAEAEALNTWNMDDGANEGLGLASDLDWTLLIEQSCRDDVLQLRWYPVCQGDGSVLWQEAMLFHPQTATMPQMSALRLVSHALRVGLVHLLDIYTLNHALKHGPEGPVAVNMSPASLSDPDFLPQVLQLLRQSPVRRVHFEFHEAGMDTYWTAFLTFSRAVRTTGHLVAVEIQGHDMNLVARTRDANIAYLVLDPALTQGIVADEGRIALLHGLLKMAALMAIRLEAKGISTQSDIQVLAGMGIHCLTGPAISGASSA